MELDLVVPKDLKVLTPIADAVGKLSWSVAQHGEELNYMEIVETVQLATLRKVEKLLNDRNKVITTILSKLIEPYPVEVKNNFVENIMKYSMI